MLDDLWHDAIDELVVQLDAALALRFLEHVVDEAHLRLVARFVARECADRRVEILIVEKREEGGFEARVASPEREAGIFDVADAYSGRHIGRRRAIDDHLRSAMVHVVVGRDDGDARRLEANLEILGRRRRQHAQIQKRGARRRDDHARGARLQLGDALFAERPHDADLIAVDLRDGGAGGGGAGGGGRVEREERIVAAVLFDARSSES